MNIKEYAAQAVGRAFPGKGMIPIRDAWVFLGGRKTSVPQLIFFGKFPLPRVPLGGEGKGVRWYVPSPALAEEYARRISASGWLPEEVTGEGVGKGQEARRGRHRKVFCGEVGHDD